MHPLVSRALSHAAQRACWFRAVMLRHSAWALAQLDAVNVLVRGLGGCLVLLRDAIESAKPLENQACVNLTHFMPLPR